MSSEDDTYSTIFTALKHPIRRKILRRLQTSSVTYTELLNELSIENGLLNYHLESMRDLITKNEDEKYTLSEFGKATVNLVRGVEEPSRTVRVVSTPPIMKIFTAIVVVALVVSGIGLIELNNSFLDLSGRYNIQSIEMNYIQSALTASDVSRNRLNATLTTLEKNPLVKASTMIIDRVGIDYFNKYFHDPTVTTNLTNLPNVTRVNYLYRIEVNGYSVNRNVTFYFHPSYVEQYGLPMEGNLQPFKVSGDEATRLALNSGLPISHYNYLASIYWNPDTDMVIINANGTIVSHPYSDKYLWSIISYIDPPWARSRTFREALVDPVTGKVYRISGLGGTGLIESQVDTAAKAKAQGLDGYVKLQYSQLPQQIQIVKGGNLTFTIRASFISFNSSRQEVRLIVDPQYVDPYQIQSNMGDQLRNYLSYVPNGTITLRAGESVNINAIIHAPDNLGSVFFFPRMYLDSLGIGVKGILVLSDLEV